MVKDNKKRYEFFNQIKHSNSSKKIKSWLKWIKIILYIFIFGITLTGCVQSFVYPSSNQVGTGVELSNDANANPQINTTKYVFTENRNTSDIGDYFVSISDSRENILVNKVLLAKLKTQFSASTNSVNKIESGTKSAGIILKNTFVSGSLKNIEGSGLNQIVNNNSRYLAGVEKDKTISKYTSIYNSYSDIFYLSIRRAKENSKVILTKVGNFEDQLFNAKNRKTNVLFKKNDDNTYSFVKDTIQKVNKKNVKSSLIIAKLDLKASIAKDKKIGVQSRVSALIYSKDFIETIYQEIILKNQFFLGVPKILARLNKDPSIALSEDEVKKTFAYIKTVSNIFSLAEIKYGATQNEVFAKENLIGVAEQRIIIVNSWNEAWGYGPFYGLVVYPLYLLTQLVLDGAIGWASGFAVIFTIFIIVWLVRILSFSLTFKSTFSQEKMNSLSPKKAQIDAKYVQYGNDREMKQRKSQEINALYKKNGVNPLSSITQIILQLPLFVAMFRIIQGMSVIKSTVFLGVSFAATSWQELFYNEQFQYIPILIVAATMQLLSQLLPRLLRKNKNAQRVNVIEKEQMKKANKTQNIMLVVFVIFAVAFSAGIQVYWIVGALYTITQTIALHYFKKTRYFREKLDNKQKF